MKNMKIEINKDQPLDEVVKELRLRNYNPYAFEENIISNWIYAYADGDYSNYEIDFISCDHVLTTLAELKEMK